ncbi:hypothetical protein FRC02_001835 [Tulasnella sp. 418]|nr:hypothetical protein FRC02_001835 [Tulasnella sp. 418]
MASLASRTCRRRFTSASFIVSSSTRRLTSSKYKIQFLTSRSFSSSPYLSATHYDALGLTPKATRHQIKAAFYKLSKELHPDVNKSGDDASKQRYLTASEAYTVLGDERRRRAYDRNLLGTNTSTTTSYKHPTSTSTHYPDLTRRARATYAWDHTRRHRASTHTHGHHQQPHKQYAWSHTHQSTSNSSSTFTSSTRRGDARSGGFTSDASQFRTPWEKRLDAEERVRRDSGLKRLLQVVGVLGVVMMVGGSVSPR